MFILIVLVLIGILYFLVWPVIQQKQQHKKLKKWYNTPKDIVVLHAIRRGRTVSHPSPFVVKVETFLRMAGIKYETDFSLSDAWGPKGRFPWISINGQHIGDSELIIQYLKRKFNVDVNKNYSKEELAFGASMRVMMDEHFFWGLALCRFVFSSFETLKSVMGSHVKNWRIHMFRFYAGRAFSSRAKSQGLGLHTKSEIEKMTIADLRHLSTLIGKRKFLLGDEPCEYDCGVFGQLSQCMWGLPGSVYERVVNNELSNLKDYSIRMRDTFYPDWNSLLEE